MSIEQKQAYLRTTVLDKGIGPEEFFQHWMTTGLEFDEVSLKTLQTIVIKFIDIKEKEKAKREEDEQFDDFQQAQVVPPKIETNNFNWDFLSLMSNKNNNHQNSKGSAHQKGDHKKTNDTSYSKKQVSNTGSSKSQQKKQVQQAIEIESLTEQQGQKRYILAQGNPRQQKTLTVKEVLSGSKVSQIKCLKLQENVLSHHVNVEIMITNIQQVEDKNSNLINKLMKSTNTLFTIKTVARNKNRSVGLSWEVKRRPQDFEWLRSTLVKFYPGLVVPSLPTIPKSKDKALGYQKKLQHFLLDCYWCPELRNSKYYEADFDNFVKNSLSISKPKDLTHILNMNGVVQTLSSENIDKYGGGLEKYLTKMSGHLKQVKNILTQINDAFSNISEQYTNLAQLFEEMSIESHQFSQQRCFERLAQTYKQISLLTFEHSNFCESEKDFIQTFMQSHFSYEKDRVDNMQSLITKRNYFATQLLKRPKQENKGMFSKIGGLFGQRMESLDIPSNSYEVLSNQVGYYNNQLLRESVRCIEVMINSHINHFSGYGHSRIDNVDNMQKLWSTLLVQLSKLNFK